MTAAPAPSTPPAPPVRLVPAPGPAVDRSAALLVSFLLAIALLVIGTQPRVRHAGARLLGMEKSLPAHARLVLTPFTADDDASRDLAVSLPGRIATRFTPRFLILSDAAGPGVTLRTGTGAATLAVVGQLRRLDAGYRVHFELLDSASGSVLRTATFDAPANELESRMTRALAAELDVEP